MAVGVFEPQAHLGPILLQVEKLFGVEGSTSLPGGGRERERARESERERYEERERKKERRK